MVEQYIKDKQLAWAPTTLKSEKNRLNSVKAHLDGRPETLWNAIQHLAPYSRLTLWTRVVDMYDWAQSKGLANVNEYRLFRKTNARLFKNAYKRTKPSIDYNEASKRIESIPSEKVRALATLLLSRGLRSSEAQTLNNGKVTGKGNKVRDVFAEPVERVPYHTLRRALNKVGLKPHDLRKLFLTECVARGANEFELCEIAGWSNIATASSYIKVSESRVKQIVQGVVNGE